MYCTVFHRFNSFFPFCFSSSAADVTMAAAWDPTSALLVPSLSDDGVVAATAHLEEKLFSLTSARGVNSPWDTDSKPVVLSVEESLENAASVLSVEESLENAASFLQIASNISAMDANRVVMLQECQFDAIRLCDAWNLMLTNYKISSNDILERLYVAYLKLLDGFPDLAQEDVATVSRQVNGMILAAEKARRVFSEAKQKIRRVNESFQKSEGLSGVKESFANLQNDAKLDLKRRYFGSRGKKYGCKIREKIDKFLLDLDELRRVGLNTSVAKESLRHALLHFEQAEVPLREAEQLARNWYTECLNVVEQTMRENIAETKKMTVGDRREFWKQLPFVQQAFEFLCR
jgi:hypothetical protein